MLSRPWLSPPSPPKAHPHPHRHRHPQQPQAAPAPTSTPPTPLKLHPHPQRQAHKYGPCPPERPPTERPTLPFFHRHACMTQVPHRPRRRAQHRDAQVPVPAHHHPISLILRTSPSVPPHNAQERRAALADALNTAMLKHLGLPTVTALERVLQQAGATARELTAANHPAAHVLRELLNPQASLPPPPPPPLGRSRGAAAGASARGSRGDAAAASAGDAFTDEEAAVANLPGDDLQHHDLAAKSSTTTTTTTTQAPPPPSPLPPPPPQPKHHHHHHHHTTTTQAPGMQRPMWSAKAQAGGAASHVVSRSPGLRCRRPAPVQLDRAAAHCKHFWLAPTQAGCALCTAAVGFSRGVLQRHSGSEPGRGTRCGGSLQSACNVEDGGGLCACCLRLSNYVGGKINATEGRAEG
eukprot:358302-Chlamydomonas_euryale.AAC.10